MAKAAEQRPRPGLWESHSRPQGVRHVCRYEGGAQSVRRAGRFELRESHAVHLGSRRQKNVQGTEWWQRTARVLRWSTPAVTTEYYTLRHVRSGTSYSRFWRLSSPSPRCWQVEFPLRPLLFSCAHMASSLCTWRDRMLALRCCFF